MANTQTHDERRKHATWVFVTALLVSLFLVVHMLWTFFTAIVLALVLVALSLPMERALRARVKRPVVSTALTTLFVVLVVVLPTGGFIAALVNESVTVLQDLRDGALKDEIADILRGQSALVDRVRSKLAALGLPFSADAAASTLTDLIQSALRILSSRLTGVAGDTLTLVLHFMMMIVVLAALFLEGAQLKQFIFDLSPLPDDEEELLVTRFTSLARAVFLGNGVASVLQGVFGGLGFFLFDAGPAFLWGTVIGIFAFLPLVGGTIVFLPATVYLAATFGVGKATGFLIYNMIYVTILEYGLKPRLIGGQTHMSPVLVFIAIIAGLATYGVMGIFIGPLVVTVFLTLVDLWRARYRSSSIILPQTELPPATFGDDVIVKPTD